MNFNRPFHKRLLSTILLAVVVLAATRPGCAQTQNAPGAPANFLMSVAFKTNNPFGNSPPMSGPEPAATAANPLFGAANVWNNLQVPYAVLNTDPAWNNLLDSTGGAPGVNLSITGTVLAVDLFPFPLPNVDPLRSAFIAWNSWTNGGGGAGPGESTSISWTLTGLSPRTTFDMCIYGSVADFDRSFDMTIQGTTMSIPTFNSANSPQPNCVLFSNITSDAQGTISGVGAGVGNSTTAANEANWSGFQLVQVRRGTGKPGGRIGFQQSPR